MLGESTAAARVKESGRTDLAHQAVTHGYLAGERPLFASYHAPKAPARNIAYVVCQPLHYDLIQCYRSFRACAEELAAAGFHVMRVQYDGTNESVAAQDRDPDRVAAWLESVRRAVSAVAAIPGVESVGIVGARIGAAFALKVATQETISHLVLWEPSPGNFYSREMEILAASTPQNLQAGADTSGGGGGDGSIVAGGYWFTKETLADIGKLDLEKMQPRGSPHVLLVYRDDRRPPPRLQQHLEKLGCATKSVQLAGFKEMMQLPHKSLVPRATLAGIREWAVEHSRLVEGIPQTGDVVKLAPEIVLDGLRWRTVRFGAEKHLFGVITEPVAGPRAGLPAVLLLTGGVVPRTSGNGSYVTIARRLASRGHRVMRMDAAFIGESGTADGKDGDQNEAFPPTIVEDARAGLDQVCAGLGANARAWLLGLCSGAYSSFHTMLKDERPLGAFLLNPIVFHMERGDLGTRDAEGPAPAEKSEKPQDATPLTTVDSLEQMSRYWQVMRDPEAWKKLLSGKANVRNIATVVSSRLGSKLAATRERLALKLGRPPKGLPGDFDKLLERGLKVNVVFSEGDPGHAGFLTEIGVRLDQLVGKGMVVRVFKGADHNFHEMTTRAELIDWVEATISGGA